jgi:ferredoxin-type protein NapH
VAFLALLVYGAMPSTTLFGGALPATTLLEIIPLVDPLAAVEVTLATRHVQSEMLIGAGILCAGAVLLGPVFCGFACPLGLLLDLGHAVRRRMMRLVRRAPERGAVTGPIPPATRTILLGVVAGFAVIGGFPLFQALSPINILARAVMDVFTKGHAAALAPALLIVAGIVVVELVFPRLWCRALCPLGALYSLLGRFGIFRVRIARHRVAGSGCRNCAIACPMGIRVKEDYELAGRPDVNHRHCTRCGSCVDACRRGVLKLGFRAPRENATDMLVASDSEA